MLASVAVLLSLGAAPLEAAAPDWATRDTQRLRGKSYEAVCSGEGPGLSEARQEAVDSCTASAALHLPRKLSIRSISVTSETDAAWQQEVTGRSRVAGLVCNPKREKIEETDSSVRVWMLCEFDLSRAKAENSAYGLDSLVPSSVHLGGKSRVLTLAVVPACSSLILSGAAPARIVRCDRNPISVIVRPEDREVLIRSKGRIPKRLKLTNRDQVRQYATVTLPPAG